MHRVLVVDDDPTARVLLVAILSRQGNECDCARDGAEAIEKLRRGRYCAIVLDVMLPRVDGFEVIEFLRSASPEALSRVVVVTAADATLRDFDRIGICNVIRKPFDIADVGAVVRGCAEQRRHDH